MPVVAAGVADVSVVDDGAAGGGLPIRVSSSASARACASRSAATAVSAAATWGGTPVVAEVAS